MHLLFPLIYQWEGLCRPVLPLSFSGGEDYFHSWSEGRYGLPTIVHYYADC